MSVNGNAYQIRDIRAVNKYFENILCWKYIEIRENRNGIHTVNKN
jgi:hypothetical protein